MRCFASIIFIFIAVGFLYAQNLSEDIAKARSIRLLEANANEVVGLIGTSSPFENSPEMFSRESSQLKVSYSTGQCTTDEAFGVVPSDWNIDAGKVVTVDVIPREKVKLEQLELGAVKLQSEQLYRGIDDYRIYYNKAEGIAVVTFDEYVDEIQFFPAKSSYSRLCNDKKIRSYYSKAGWKRDPRPKMICILRNQYANVVDVTLTQTSDRFFEIKTTAIDPENDVLTYNYKASAGRIQGNGSKVVRDLTSVPTGNYTITVGVDDGAGIVGKVVTRTVTVK
jgi:hypothetical protein